MHARLCNLFPSSTVFPVPFYSTASLDEHFVLTCTQNPSDLCADYSRKLKWRDSLIQPAAELCPADISHLWIIWWCGGWWARIWWDGEEKRENFGCVGDWIRLERMRWDGENGEKKRGKSLHQVLDLSQYHGGSCNSAITAAVCCAVIFPSHLHPFCSSHPQLSVCLSVSLSFFLEVIMFSQKKNTHPLTYVPVTHTFMNMRPYGRVQTCHYNNITSTLPVLRRRELYIRAGNCKRKVELLLGLSGVTISWWLFIHIKSIAKSDHPVFSFVWE